MNKRFPHYRTDGFPSAGLAVLPHGSSAIIRYYCYIPCTSTLLQATACHTFHTLYVLSFLTYLGLAEAGVGTATVVALYTPLALKQTEEVNSILSATRKFYNKSGMLFLALTLVLIGVYPFFISGQLENSLVRWMILVLAGSTLVDYFFLGKYRVLLTANQEGYVVALIQAAGTIVNMVVSIFLIYIGAGVLFVKAVATGVYMLRLVLVKIYAKRKYPALDFYAEPNEGALKQKNAALLHQVVGIIVNNTDTTVLTICLGAKSLLAVRPFEKDVIS